jgi:hypothetical protein
MSMRGEVTYVGVLSLMMVAPFGCGTEGEEIAVRTSALLQGDRPMGFTCGLAYTNGYAVYPLPDISPVNGKCMGFPTIPIAYPPPDNSPPAPGFALGNDGDAGLRANLGFYHQYLQNSTGDTDDEEYPERLLLPKGTACGFKKTCGASSGITCMGSDPKVRCPNGWQQRQASDANNSPGCNYVWCEYTDPHGVCATADCQFNLQPPGIVCGITDSDYPDTPINSKLAKGRCLGAVTNNSCPSGISGGYIWRWHGRYDDGRHAGHGLAWCSKELIP